MIGIRRTQVSKAISTTDLRSLCIEQDYYTRGDVKAYNELFEYVKDKDINGDDVIAIATDIYEHSDIKRFMGEYNCTADEVFDSIYFNIGQIVQWHCKSQTY